MNKEKDILIHELCVLIESLRQQSCAAQVRSVNIWDTLGVLEKRANDLNEWRTMWIEKGKSDGFTTAADSIEDLLIKLLEN